MYDIAIDRVKNGLVIRKDYSHLGLDSMGIVRLSVRTFAYHPNAPERLDDLRDELHDGGSVEIIPLGHSVRHYRSQFREGAEQQIDIYTVLLVAMRQAPTTVRWHYMILSKYKRDGVYTEWVSPSNTGRTLMVLEGEPSLGSLREFIAPGQHYLEAHLLPMYVDSKGNKVDTGAAHAPFNTLYFCEEAFMEVFGSVPEFARSRINK